ncbi:MAG TPA: cupredoxin domain-containing protein [Myxococcaceae bacterium]|nr:cupredoxin domain-containing protein [Myxococcaceae bacterium]
MNPLGKVLKWALAVALGAGVWAGRAEAGGATAAASPRVVRLTVTDKGYEPSPVTLKKGEPVRLLVTRKSDRTCATEIVMDDPKVQAALPLNQEVEVAFTPSKTGQLKYGCAMDKMVSGVFVVE